MNKVYRSFDVAINRSETSNETMTVEGYALKFDKETIINDYFGKYYETIDRSAMEGANIDDVVFNFNHNMDNIFSRTTNGTLSLIVDDIGLKIKAVMADTSLSKDVYTMINEGLINRMSFQVEIADDKWETGEILDKRTITQFGRFFDVSAVTFPAYQDTLIEARSNDELAIKHFNLKEREKMKREELAKPTEEVTNEETITDELQNEVDEVNADVDEVKKDVDEVKLKADSSAKESTDNVDQNIDNKSSEENKEENKSMEERSMEVMSKDIESKKVEERNIYSTTEYRDAYFTSVREGNETAVKRFLATNGSGNESVLVPTMLADKIETAVRTGGTIAALCTKLSMKGLYSIPVEISATDSSLHVEGAAAPAEEEITFGEILIKPQMIKKWIAVTDEMEALAISDFAEYLSNEISDKILVKLDEQIIAGATTDGVIGIINGTSEYVSSAVVSDLATAGFTAQGSLSSAVNPTIVFNRKYFFNNIMTLKATDGTPIFSAINENGKTSYFYNGMPVELVNNSKLANTSAETTKPAFVCGDFSAYTLNFPNGYGVSLLRDPYTKAPDDLVRYIGKLYAGGNVTKLASFFVGKLA